MRCLATSSHCSQWDCCQPQQIDGAAAERQTYGRIVESVREWANVSDLNRDAEVRRRPTVNSNVKTVCGGWPRILYSHWLDMAVNHCCCRTCNLFISHLLLQLVVTMMMMMTLAVSAERSFYRRRVGLLRSTNHLPTDPWELFNISITQTGNKTEGTIQILTIRCTQQC